AGIRRQLAVDHVEAGGFAGAVRPDQREEFARREFECHIVDGAHAAERFRQARDREHAHGAALRGRHSAAAPARPLGKINTSTKMIPPSRARQYSVWRMTVSCSSAKAEAPTIGPLNVWMPPSSTMTRPSIERPT